MPADNLILERRPARSEQDGDFTGDLISIGLLVGLSFTTLAFGAVEPWSIAIFGMLIIGLSLLWAIKSIIDRRLRLVVPSIAWPLVALIVWGLLQSLYRVDESGRRFAVSMDVEATRLTLEVLLVLFFAFLIFANFFASGKRLLWFRNFLILFGLALSVFGLIQKFTWNGKYYWIIQP
ncbi:MAG: hypothetical protein AAB401_24515, partial [Acidobacteriota bacterium]